MCAALFELGQLSYSKARVITRHATAETDEAFTTATLELAAEETEAWCEHFHHERDANQTAQAENSGAHAALLAFEKHALHKRALNAHNTRITLDLPNDLAEEFLRSLEQCGAAMKQVQAEKVFTAGNTSAGGAASDVVWQTATQGNAISAR